GEGRRGIDPEKEEALPSFPDPIPGERALSREGRVLRDPRTQEGEDVDREHRENVRPDASHDGPLEDPRGNGRHRDEARGILRLEELGRGALSGANGVRYRDGRRRGALRGEPRAAGVRP